MTSEQGKTVIRKSWRCQSLEIKQNGFNESTSFGDTTTTNSPTRFYLRLNKRAQLTLHLAICSQKKLHIDKFEVLAVSDNERYIIKSSASGEIYLSGYSPRYGPRGSMRGPNGTSAQQSGMRPIFLSTGPMPSAAMDEINYWNIDCTVTYSEPLVKTDHKQPLSEHLAALRLDSDSSDVTLVTVADGKEHSAQKWILSMRSPVFATMFSHEGLLENVLNRVEIEEVTGEVMEAFLDYVYSGNVRKVDQFAVQLFELANKYDIQPLAKACIEAISVDNAAQLYYLADLQQEENFKKFVLRFISANKEAVKKTNGWNVFVEPHAKLLSQLIDYL